MTTEYLDYMTVSVSWKRPILSTEEKEREREGAHVPKLFYSARVSGVTSPSPSSVGHCPEGRDDGGHSRQLYLVAEAALSLMWVYVCPTRGFWLCSGQVFTYSTFVFRLEQRNLFTVYR